MNASYSATWNSCLSPNVQRLLCDEGVARTCDLEPRLPLTADESDLFAKNGLNQSAAVFCDNIVKMSGDNDFRTKSVQPMPNHPLADKLDQNLRPSSILSSNYSINMTWVEGKLPGTKMTFMIMQRYH